MVRIILALSLGTALVIFSISPRPAGATVYTVTNNFSSGTGSLAQAVALANAKGGADTIVFDIFDPAQRPVTIGVTGLVITDELLINGYTQAGALLNTNNASQPFNGRLKIEISGVGLGGSVPLIAVQAANCELRGLALTGAEGAEAILIQGGNGNSVTGCFVGLRANGSYDDTRRNQFSGVHVVFGSDQNTIGGTSPSQRNVIAGNTAKQVEIWGDANFVRGNIIGLLPDGVSELPVLFDSGYGVFVRGNSNIIGGAVGGGRNIISRSSQDGVWVNGDDNIIRRNRIGTDVSGTLPRGNTFSGVEIGLNAARNIVGGRVNGGDNVICDNRVGVTDRGVGTIIRRNKIGVGASSVPMGNLFEGIFSQQVFPGVGTMIGGDLLNDGNEIAHNGRGGIQVTSPDVEVTIRHNSIYSNGDWDDPFSPALAIDVGASGVQANDLPDVDGIQNYPVFSAVVNLSAGVEVTGTLDSVLNPPYVIEFFVSPGCDPSGHGEGKLFVGSMTTSTAAFQFTVPPPIAYGEFLSATATNASGDTSEFSLCAPIDPFTVVNTQAAGAGSFWDAIVAANFSAGVDTIRFNIPGPGPHFIEPLQIQINEAIYIDGYTQPGASPNTAQGLGPTNAQIAIQISLREDKGQSPSFIVNDTGSTIRGLSLTGGSPSSSLLVLRGGGGHKIEGCWIGIDPSGFVSSIAGIGIEILGGSEGNEIGGLDQGQRNVIVGADFSNLHVMSSSNLICNNFIGVLPDGVTDAGSTLFGIYLVQPSGGLVDQNQIGDWTGNGPNLISGHADDGIYVFGASGTIIMGNSIGTDTSGALPLPNGGAGIRIQSAGVNQVGYVMVNEVPNRIAFNGGAGIQIDPLLGSVPCGVILANEFEANGGLAIDLGGDGVTANDPVDEWLDHPILHVASSSAVETSVRGTVFGASPSNAVTVYFYASDSCDPSGHGEGVGFLGSRTFIVENDATYSFSTGFAIATEGRFITAYAVDGCQTSEFSSCALSEPPNTAVGGNVVVAPETGLSVEFSTVDVTGYTSVVSGTSNPGSTPSGFEFQGVFYDIESTALFSGNVIVCLDYDDTGMSAAEENGLKLFHFQSGLWIDVTTSVDAINNVICGESSSLSPFAVAMPLNPTAVDFPDNLPLLTRLRGAAPNPFNPSTTISFDVARDGLHVSLVVFDARGARVRTLVDGRRNAGTNRIRWDGRDDRGRMLSSGVYFARFQAEEYVSSSRMVLLK